MDDDEPDDGEPRFKVVEHSEDGEPIAMMVQLLPNCIQYARRDWIKCIPTVPFENDRMKVYAYAAKFEVENGKWPQYGYYESNFCLN